MTGTTQNASSTPEEAINEFWKERFECLRNEIKKTLKPNDTEFDISLSIMSFDHPRLHYCKGIEYPNDDSFSIALINEKLKKIAANKAAQCMPSNFTESASIGDIYDTHVDTKNIMTSEAVEINFLNRQTSYNLLSQVLFPESATFVPGKMKPAQRKKDFKFKKDNSYSAAMAASYALDARVFPFEWIAAWPIFSYQPSAIIYIRANFKDPQLQENNRWLTRISKVITKWEIPIESELLALRITLFQEALASAIGVTDQKRAQEHIAEASRFLIFNMEVEWIDSADTKYGSQSLKTQGSTDSKVVPSSDKIGDLLSRTRAACPTMSLPKLTLNQWQHSQTMPHHDYLLERAYDILLTETASLFNLAQGNKLQAASGLTDFFAHKTQSEVFLRGMREVIRVHEKLSLESPLGSESFGRLCIELQKTFGGYLHNIFDEDQAAKFELGKNSTLIADALQSKEIIKLILSVRDDLRQGGANGLSRYLLLKPLSPAWLSIVPPAPTALEKVKNPFAITCCMVKAISRGMIWLPHLHLLLKPCLDYGNPSGEWSHINEQWKNIKADEFRKRIEINEKSYSPFSAIGFMKAFADLCATLNADRISIDTTCNSEHKIKINFILKAPTKKVAKALADALNNATENEANGNSYDMSGNFVSAANRLVSHVGKDNLTITHEDKSDFATISILGITVSNIT